MSTLQELLVTSSGNTQSGGDKPAIIIPDGGITVSYKELIQQIESVRDTLLTTGVSSGDNVAIVLPNGYPFLVSFFAVTWARVVVSPLNSAYTKDEFTFYLQDLEAKFVILPPGPHAAREAATQLKIPILEVQEDGAKKNVAIHLLDPIKPSTAKAQHLPPTPGDIALFLHTSGTTSRPKGVPLSHLNLSTSATNIVNTYKLTASDASLVVMPLFHVHGLLAATIATFASGGTAVIPVRFSASTFWHHIKEHNITWYTAVPTIHQVLLLREEEVPAHKLRFIRSCSAALAPSTLGALEKKTGVPVLEAYGMTEAAHQMASNPLPEQGPHKPSSVGRGTNVEIGILDDEGKHKATDETGEVCIRGANVTKGYHNNPEANRTAFTADGWFRTGDQGYLDKEGYLFITGRLKELINRAGEKIMPGEVDNAMLEHPAVAEAVCFGAPDTKYGEEVHAAVVPKGNERPSEEEIITFLQARLSAFKIPKKIYFTDSLPRTATGKIQRRHIAAYFLEEKKK